MTPATVSTHPARLRAPVTQSTSRVQAQQVRDALRPAHPSFGRRCTPYGVAARHRHDHTSACKPPPSACAAAQRGAGDSGIRPGSQNLSLDAAAGAGARRGESHYTSTHAPAKVSDPMITASTAKPAAAALAFCIFRASLPTLPRWQFCRGQRAAGRSLIANHFFLGAKRKDKKIPPRACNFVSVHHRSPRCGAAREPRDSAPADVSVVWGEYWAAYWFRGSGCGHMCVPPW